MKTVGQLLRTVAVGLFWGVPCSGAPLSMKTVGQLLRTVAVGLFWGVPCSGAPLVFMLNPYFLKVLVALETKI
jgi:hypothetical protein